MKGALQIILRNCSDGGRNAETFAVIKFLRTFVLIRKRCGRIAPTSLVAKLYRTESNSAVRT